MTVMLDVSAAVEVLLSGKKAKLYESYLADAELVIAPDLYVHELSNVVWKYFSAGALSRDDAVFVAEGGLQLVDDFVSGAEIWKEALSEGMKQGHPIYDMMYLVTARRNGGKVLTNDKRLAELAKKMGIDVVADQ